MEIEILDVKQKSETEEERAKRLYKNGNIIEYYGNLFLVKNIKIEEKSYWMVLKIGSDEDTPILYESLEELISDSYGHNDRLVKRFEAEVEE